MQLTISQKLAATWCEWPKLQTLHEQALACNLARRLHQIAHKLRNPCFNAETTILWEETVDIWKKLVLYKGDPKTHQNDLVTSLQSYAWHLRRAGHRDLADPIAREAARLSQQDPSPGIQNALVLSIDIGMSTSAVTAHYSEQSRRNGKADPGNTPSRAVITNIASWPGHENNRFEEKVPSLLVYDWDGKVRGLVGEI